MSSLMEKIAQGKFKKQTLPGADFQNCIPKLDTHMSGSLSGQYHSNYRGRSYVDIALKEYDEENRECNQLSNTAVQSSSMSSVDSITEVGSIADFDNFDKALNEDEIKLYDNYKFKDPLAVSNNLEIAKYKDQIIQTINANTTILITGVTGCGKSTQVPQFILDDCIAKRTRCNIIVTQPRRISAISVSKQVNKERGWKKGLLVGYQVGRKRDFDPSTMKILYCTTGILLQKIIKAKNLNDFTHIILDEVHERSLEMDFLLLIIKRLLKTNSQSTRVVLMSATANEHIIRDYFSEYYGPPINDYQQAPKVNVGIKHNYHISIHYLEDLYVKIPASRRIELSDPNIDDAGYETAVQLVEAFDKLEQVNEVVNKSSVLIFLPGIFEIEEMHRFMENAMSSRNHKWILLPLHSSITSEEQDRVFDVVPLHHRKIILSTNIAESSITVPDVSYVIDFCLIKQLRNEMKSNYSMLVRTWASKSNCDQRSGRVGRVSDGRVYRLVTSECYENFSKVEQPEMMRCNLSSIILMSKLLNMGTPLQILASAMDPPIIENIELTMFTLKQVGALLPTVNGILSSTDGDITFMGRVMAFLPLQPPMSKLIYLGYIFNILNEAIIMACGLSIKSIFSQPFNKRLEAYTQKLTWANNSCSDPIAFINPYLNWLTRREEFELNKSNEIRWAKHNYIQLPAIRELHDLVDDVTFRLKSNLGIVANSGHMKWDKPAEKAMAMKVILAGAFYPNYFVIGMTKNIDEYNILKILDDHDPNRTVYLNGFPYDQPKELYKEAIENMFPKNLVGKPTAYFNNSNKVFIEFPSSSISNIHQRQLDASHLIPGNICFGVYVALKMNQLKVDFKIPLLKPLEAKKRIEDFSKEMAQRSQKQENVLPAKKCILEEIEAHTKVIDIAISMFESIDCFWAQLFDVPNIQKLTNIWNTINENIKLTNVHPRHLRIGDIYIVDYTDIDVNEKYRAKLIHILPGPQEKYKFLLIDFGEVVELSIESVFEIFDQNKKNKVFNIPALAFQCKIAKICPAVLKNLEPKWSSSVNDVFENFKYPQILVGTIYSIIDGVVSLEDLCYVNGEKIISIPKLLIQKKLANQSEELFASKIDHDRRSKHYGNSNIVINHKFNTCSYFKSPTVQESSTMHHFKGVHNPLVLTIQGINRNSYTHLVKIESQSVNSILLDTTPNDNHEKLFVAGNVCVNDNNRLTLWDTTMMPNIPGLPAIMCLIFSPCVEIRHNDSYTKMIGAICGLGYDPVTLEPLFKENDIEITFDTEIDQKMLDKVNAIRMLLNKCINPDDEEGPGDIFQIQFNLQKSLMELLSHPTKTKALEVYGDRYRWGCIPNSRLLSPYQINSPVIHPMAGSDVYKLLWRVQLSSKMNSSDSKVLENKLFKVKRFEEILNSYNCCSNSEDLNCPLCMMSFSSRYSMNIHFKTHQHNERYKNAIEELHIFTNQSFNNV